MKKRTLILGGIIMGAVLVSSPAYAQTSTLDQLLAQIAALQAQIAQLQNQQAISQTITTAACPNLIRNLARNSRGADVTALQNFLIAQGYLEAGNNTGFYGALTEAAVKQFQCKQMSICSGSPSTNGYGAVGPRTRAAIRTSCATINAMPASTPVSTPTQSSNSTPTPPSPISPKTPLSVTTQNTSLCIDCIQIRFGRPLVVRAPASDEFDAPLHEIKLADGTYRAFTSNQESYAINAAVPWSLGGPRVKIADKGLAGSDSECGNWLFDTERIGSLLYGFFHSEKACDYANGQSHKSMSLSTSENNGLTWDALETVISSTAQPEPGKITGEGDCTVVNGNDGYLYAYCLRPSSTTWDTTVSRAPVSDPAPANWRKWDGNGWNLSAQNSMGAPLGTFGQASAFWKSENSQMLTTTNKWLGGLQLAFASNFLNFTALQEPLLATDDDTWARPAPTDLIAYPSMFSDEDVSDDITDSFFLTYTYLPPGGDFSKKYLVMQNAWIWKTNSPQSPQVGVALSQWKDQASSRPWVTSGPMIGTYDHQKVLGYVMTRPHPVHASVKLEECSSDWPGFIDHLLTNDGTCAGGGYTRLRTAGWVYSEEQPGTTAIYRCYSSANQYHFASTNAQCDGQGNMEWRLGYLLNN